MRCTISKAHAQLTQRNHATPCILKKVVYKNCRFTI